MYKDPIIIKEVKIKIADLKSTKSKSVTIKDINTNSEKSNKSIPITPRTILGISWDTFLSNIEELVLIKNW